MCAVGVVMGVVLCVGGADVPDGVRDPRGDSGPPEGLGELREPRGVTRRGWGSLRAPAGPSGTPGMGC